MAEFSSETLELFAEIGTRLRAAREERGYSLQELSAHTRIHQSFLEKIEAGDLAALPGMAFVKGFIRNYIQVLQIEDGELEEQVQRLGAERRTESASNLRPSNPQLLDSAVERPSSLRLVLIVVAVALLAWLGYVFFQGGGEQPPATATPAPTEQGAATGQAAAPAGTPGATVEAPAAETPTAAPAPGPAPAGKPPTAQPGGTQPAAAPTSGPVEGRQKLELTLRGLEPSWVRLSIDRAPAVDIFLRPAETVAWEANQEFQLVIGKSKGVAVYLNGEEYPLPQEPNRLIPNLVLNKLTLLRLEN